MILAHRLFAAIAAVLMVSPPAASAPTKKPVDWTRTVVATPDGGFRMGNPAAKVKLVEYGSLTCPHCRHFAEEASVPLKAKVKSGKVSFEYRSFVLNGVDASATLVARCGGTARFFPILDSLFAAQGEWIAKVNGLAAADKEKLVALPEGQRLVGIATAAGLQKMAAAKGLPIAQANQCLADKAGFDRVGKIFEQAVALGVQGTPTFFVNGTKVDASDWKSLEPLIDKAGG